MSYPQQPTPTRPRWSRAGAVVIVLLLAAAVFGVLALVGVFTADDTPEALCRLLEDGTSQTTIVHSDVWRDWPSDKTIAERLVTVRSLASTHCPDAL